MVLALGEGPYYSEAIHGEVTDEEIKEWEEIYERQMNQKSKGDETKS